MFIWTGWTGSISSFSYRSTRYSNSLHDFSVTIIRCYKDVYVNNFFPWTVRLWNSLPAECFPLIYDLNGFKSRAKRQLFSFFLKSAFLYHFYLFLHLFLITPCHVLAFQPFMEWQKLFNIEKMWFFEKKMKKWKIHDIFTFLWMPVITYHFWKIQWKSL